MSNWLYLCSSVCFLSAAVTAAWQSASPANVLNVAGCALFFTAAITALAVGRGAK